MKRSVYLDSTVFNYLFDERAEFQTFRGITQRWWDEERARHDVFVSEQTLAELGEGDYPHKKQTLALLPEIPVLPRDGVLLEVARTYVDHFVMPRQVRGDALHLAYASFYRMDVLLTWNCEHLANANKMQHIRVINARMGLMTPQIVTPIELFEEGP